MVYFSLWLFGVYENVKVVLILIFFILLIIKLVAFLFMIFTDEYYQLYKNTKENYYLSGYITFNIAKNICKKIKTFYMIILGSFLMLLPNTKTVTIMSGLYVGEHIYHKTNESPLFTKAVNLVEGKLDELINETKREK